jgi:hypothetical protein
VLFLVRPAALFILGRATGGNLSEPKLDALSRLALSLQRTDVSELPLVFDGDDGKPEGFQGSDELN